MNKLHEECGVFGVYGKGKAAVAATTYYGLFALQHRGQESCASQPISKAFEGLALREI